MKRPSLEQFKANFWARTVRIAPRLGEAIGCLLWTGTLDAHGYGQVGWGRNNLMKCHRLVMEWELGFELTPEQKVLHDCDTPSCVETAHLRVGTQQDNIRDMMSRGRHHKLAGEESPRAKLKTADVDYIRNNLQKTPLLEIAALYGITPGYACALRKGKYWKLLHKS